LVHPYSEQKEMAGKSALSKLTIHDLQREISSRQRSVATLERRRERLVKQLAEVDAEIAARGGLAGWSRGGKTGRTRAKNEAPLLDALKEVLKGKTMGVSEVAEAVQKAGYKTTSPNFRTIVNQTLLKKKHFKRVGRGQYTANG
jgi:hypothetical protein